MIDFYKTNKFSEDKKKEIKYPNIPKRIKKPMTSNYRINKEHNFGRGKSAGIFRPNNIYNEYNKNIKNENKGFIKNIKELSKHNLFNKSLANLSNNKKNIKTMSLVNK